MQNSEKVFPVALFILIAYYKQEALLFKTNACVQGPRWFFARFIFCLAVCPQVATGILLHIRAITNVKFWCVPWGPFSLVHNPYG